MLNRVLFLISVFTICATTPCSLNINPNTFNFVTDDDPEPNAIFQRCVRIEGLSQNSLARVEKITRFVITEFLIDDINSLNHPHLFANHTSMVKLLITKYNGEDELVLHEDLFSGLVNVDFLDLSELNLKTIPKQLFSEMAKLKTLVLSRNKLTSLHTDVFSTNPLLDSLQLGGNELFESEVPLNLTLLHDDVYIVFNVSYITYYALTSILRNPNITLIKLNIRKNTYMRMSDFDLFPSRQTGLNLNITLDEYSLPIEDIFKNEIDYEIVPFSRIKNVTFNSKAYITLGYTNPSSTLCRDCEFLNTAFKTYVQEPNQKNFYVRLRRSNVVFAIVFKCENLENHFTNEFRVNCPYRCTCRHNPFFDKVWYDCSDKNLTRIPRIRKPSQFVNVKNFQIDLSYNMIQTIELTNINRFVTSRVRQINLCHNPFWNENPDGVETVSASAYNITYNINSLNCTVGENFPPNPLLYIRQKSTRTFNQNLKHAFCRYRYFS